MVALQKLGGCYFFFFYLKASLSFSHLGLTLLSAQTQSFPEKHSHSLPLYLPLFHASTSCLLLLCSGWMRGVYPRTDSQRLRLMSKQEVGKTHKIYLALYIVIRCTYTNKPCLSIISCLFMESFGEKEKRQRLK